MGIASLFLMDRADTWYQNWFRDDVGHSWEDFENGLYGRFGDRG